MSQAQRTGAGLFAAAVALAGLTTLVPSRRAADEAAASPYIVTLTPGAADPAAVAAEHATRLGAEVRHVYRAALRGYSARLDDAALAALRLDPRVESVSPGGRVRTSAQTIPLGVDRVQADESPTAAIDEVEAPLDIDVAVLDTGIDATHPDLTVAGGKTCAEDGRDDWRDLVGHGTHIAGTIGAKDDGVGVVGVAPGVRLWAVRVLDEEGVGEVDELICGVDWVTATRTDGDPSNDIEVANLSLGTPGRDDGECGTRTIDRGDPDNRRRTDPLHAAVCRSVEAGVVYVTAAGNAISSKDRDGNVKPGRPEDARKWVPASYDEVITVSAIADSDGQPGAAGPTTRCRPGDDDAFASFSNFGRDIDLTAPGVCVFSSLPVDGSHPDDDGYGYYNGTSFAAPHVSGAAALFLINNPGATPDEVREALVAAGSLEWDVSTDPDNDHEPLVDVSGF
jgi:subtilisin family serine protease